MNRFSETQIEALRDLAHAWTDRPFTLIGASALSHHLGLRWRHTEDLDLIVAVELDELDRSASMLGGWQRDARLEHQWWSPRGVKVDIVPAGAGLLHKGILVWPRSGFEMNLVGLDLALAHFVPVEVSAGSLVRVATVPVLTLLKMTAWLDRPSERTRDLADLAYILDEFIDFGDERRYEERVLRLGLSIELVSAYVLGRELASITGPVHRVVIERFLNAVGDPNNVPHAMMVRLGPAGWRNDDTDDEPLVRRLAAFRRGLEAAP